MALSVSPSQLQIIGKHIHIYESYYAYVDPNGHGSIGAMEAARFLKKSGLSDVVLSRVWDLSDPSGRGCLDKDGMYVALKLVALAQAGRDINMSNITLDMPPPKMGDVPFIVPKKPISIPFVGSPPTSAVDWTINSIDIEKYNKSFDSLQPVNGVIPGNRVKGVLIESKLPIETLGQIWELADQDKDGSLNRGEFIAAMHLVYKSLENHAMPSVLPPELISISTSRKNSDMSAAMVSPIPILPQAKPSVTAHSPLRPSMISTPTVFGSNEIFLLRNSETSTSLLNDFGDNPTATNIAQQGLPSVCKGNAANDILDWVVSVDERVKSDMLFLKSDIDRDGFVSGMEIKDVFLQSGVPQSNLAHIWSLCDIRQSGKLNSEQFALAMWLIAMYLKGQDPPANLAPDMVPPSFRNTSFDKLRSNENNNSSYANPELEMINNDIQELSREKSSLEMNISQKEASICNKIGETKSLQSEFDTLAATLKQLDNQKGEAYKRLGDLKSQVERLRVQASEQIAVISAEEAELLSRKEQLDCLKQEEVRLQELKQRNGDKLNGLGSELQNTQLNISQAKALISQLEEQAKQINNAITTCNCIIESGDVSSITDAILVLNPDFRDTQYYQLKAVAGKNVKNELHGKERNTSFNGNIGSFEFSEDPFSNGRCDGNTDNFETSSHIKSAFANSDGQFADDIFDKFHADNDLKSDPFGDGNITSVSLEPNKDAFGCDPFAVLHAPTRDVALHRASSPSPALPPKKAKPPRPAPPRPQPPSFNKISAGSTTEQFGSIDFANFANFDEEFSSPTKPEMPSSTILCESAKKLEFTDDPFRDYRYEDPFCIAFEEEVKYETNNGRRSTTTVPSVAPSLTSQDSVLPISTGRLSAPLYNVLRPSGTCKELSFNSGRSSVPLNFGDERQQIVWVSDKTLQLEQEIH